jgi:hypothetical protein
MDQSPMGGGLPYTQHDPSADEVKLAAKIKAARKAKPVEVPSRFSLDWPPGFVPMAAKKG